MDMMRTPPHSMEAEQALLGSMINFKECAEDGLGITAEHFYRNAHQVIFETIIQMVKTKKPIDMITIADELKKLDVYDDIGGMEYINDLTTAGIIGSSFHHYKKIVREKMKLRIAINGASEIIDYAYSSEASHEEAEQLLKNTVRRSESYIEDTDFKSIKDVMIETVDIIEKDHAAEHVGIPTGFREIDDILTLRKQKVATISGQPGAGKTTLVTNIISNMAELGYKAAIASAEMELTEIAEKILLSKSFVKSNYIRKDKDEMKEHHWSRLMLSASKISNLDIFMNDISNKTVTMLRDELVSLKRTHGLDVLMIDYLQIIRSSQKHNNDKERIEAVFTEIKQIGKDLNILVLCISSLKRGSDQRANKRPNMNDLNGTGLLEYGSDYIFFVHRPSMYDDEKPLNNVGSDKTEIIIDKQKQGRTGVKYINFIPENNTFRD